MGKEQIVLHYQMVQIQNPILNNFLCGTNHHWFEKTPLFQESSRRKIEVYFCLLKLWSGTWHERIEIFQCSVHDKTP
jgi:hypothetical protein